MSTLPSWVVSILALLVSGLLAQEFRATITGRVLAVRAVNTATNETSVATTDGSGVYTIPFLALGEYTITAEATGFKKSVMGPFRLEVNQVARVDVSLQVGALSESVEVQAVAPALQTESTQTGKTLGSKQLTDLPLNGRNVVSAMLLVPGAVQTNPGSVNTASRFSGRAFVNGNREQTNNFLLDGVYVNDSMDNRIGYTPSVDALQHVGGQRH